MLFAFAFAFAFAFTKASKGSITNGFSEAVIEVVSHQCCYRAVYGGLRLQFTANRVLAGGTGKYHDRLCGPVPPV